MDNSTINWDVSDCQIRLPYDVTQPKKRVQEIVDGDVGMTQWLSPKYGCLSGLLIVFSMNHRDSVLCTLFRNHCYLQEFQGIRIPSQRWKGPRFMNAIGTGIAIARHWTLEANVFHAPFTRQFQVEIHTFTLSQYNHFYPLWASRRPL